MQIQTRYTQHSLPPLLRCESTDQLPALARCSRTRLTSRLVRKIYMLDDVVLRNRRPRTLHRANKVVVRPAPPASAFAKRIGSDVERTKEVRGAPRTRCRPRSSPLLRGRQASKASSSSPSSGGRNRGRGLGPAVRRVVSFPASRSQQITARTGLKCVALSTFRTGCIKASRTTTAISDPEYPSVFAASCRYSG